MACLWPHELDEAFAAYSMCVVIAFSVHLLDNQVVVTGPPPPARAFIAFAQRGLVQSSHSSSVLIDVYQLTPSHIVTGFVDIATSYLTPRAHHMMHTLAPRAGCCGGLSGGAGAGMASSFVACFSPFAVDHASLSRRSTTGRRGQGRTPFVGCLRYLAIDHASLCTRSTVLFHDGNTSNIWVPIAFSPCILRYNVDFYFPILPGCPFFVTIYCLLL